jgi:prepilin-type processing-associated H-X9-DG protein
MWSHIDRPERSGMSLIEIISVLGIVAFLLALLLPGIGAARERARRTFCANNLRQWGVANQFYLDEFNGYLPEEGTVNALSKDYYWYNALPPYLGLPPYRDFDRILAEVGGDEKKFIRALPEIHTWICPAKAFTQANKSTTGYNQFHYGMNLVLDGVGTEERPSSDAPGYLDLDSMDDRNQFLQARLFGRHPNTVLLFDIVWNSPCGKPRDVATMYQRSFGGTAYIGRFHGDYANVLYVDGRVGHCATDQLVTDRDFRHGKIIWDDPTLYWGYPPPWGLEEQ